MEKRPFTSERGRSVPARNKFLSHYKLGATIGTGTFCKVKLATHLPTGQQVAVKIVAKDQIQDARDLERIRREISILHRL